MTNTLLSGQLAEMTDERTGLFGLPPFLPIRLTIPREIELTGGVLHWSVGASPESKQGKISASGLLDRFIRIGSPSQALQFVRRYGPIGYCTHDLPFTHNPPALRFDNPQDASYTLGNSGCHTRGSSTGTCFEDPQFYIEFAKRAAGILRAFASIHRGKDVQASDLDDAFKGSLHAQFLQADAQMVLKVSSEDLSRLPDPPTLGPVFVLLAMLVQEWLELSGIRLVMDWGGGDEMNLGFGGGTFSVLVIQLMSALTRTQGVAVCTGCTQLYHRAKRRDTPGKRNYCPKCRTTVANRHRQQRHRAKRRQQDAEKER